MAGLVCGARAEPSAGSCPTCTLISGLLLRGFASSTGACEVPAGVTGLDNCRMALATWHFPHGALLQPRPRAGKVCPSPGTGHDGDTNPDTMSSSPLLPQVTGGKAGGAITNTTLPRLLPAAGRPHCNCVSTSPSVVKDLPRHSAGSGTASLLCSGCGTEEPLVTPNSWQLFQFLFWLSGGSCHHLPSWGFATP